MGNKTLEDVRLTREHYQLAMRRLVDSAAYAEVVAHLQRYLDFDEQRAQTLQDIVRPALFAIKNFETDALHFGTEIGMVNITMSALATKIVAEQFPGIKLRGPAEGEQPIEAMHREMANLRQYQQAAEHGSTLVAGLNWEGVMVEAFRLGSSVLDLRHEAVRTFATRSLHLTVEDFDEAALETSKDEFFDMVGQVCDRFVELATDPETLKALGEDAAAILGSAVGPLYLVGKLAIRLTLKAREIKSVYQGRGQIDDLFEFIELVHRTSEWNETQLALLRAQAEAFRYGMKAGRNGKLN